MKGVARHVSGSLEDSVRAEAYRGLGWFPCESTEQLEGVNPEYQVDLAQQSNQKPIQYYVSKVRIKVNY